MKWYFTILISTTSKSGRINIIWYRGITHFLGVAFKYISCPTTQWMVPKYHLKINRSLRFLGSWGRPRFNYVKKTKHVCPDERNITYRDNVQLYIATLHLCPVNECFQQKGRKENILVASRVNLASAGSTYLTDLIIALFLESPLSGNCWHIYWGKNIYMHKIHT